jgi:hypothetical protein
MIAAIGIAGRDHPKVRELAGMLAPPSGMDAYDPDALFQPLGTQWWAVNGELVGASRKQVRLAAAISGGIKNIAQAGRIAGYGDKRQSAHIAARGRRVEQLVERAGAEMGRRGLGKPDLPRLRARCGTGRRCNSDL